jgi:hypothetical protein
VLCLTPLSPGAAAAAAAAAAKRGVRYAHASPGGASPAAASVGGLWFWAAGAPDALAAVSPVLSALGYGSTVLGAAPALACSATLVSQMEGLRRAALAVAQSAAGEGAAAAAEGSARAAAMQAQAQREAQAEARADAEARMHTLAMAAQTEQARRPLRVCCALRLAAAALSAFSR